MSEETRHLIAEALQLPTAERMAVIAELLASVDGEPEADSEAAWATEIERRAQRVLSGETQGTDWVEVRRQIQSGRRQK